eukprot:Plantae.Rhodophyta-Palmaria_palmata.ctg5148.p1 GENE.Plantae.Rhodophyta-Palmaria_palmata.ctg5148~~Plantae.Rhodophyta-Palmaria_palmata.ctg5148.p1  ORF type:complete len:578 (-),score=50.25 Plantae.Rhodophyta-Palmaria_palmata.ctg5148:70-1803(-)
MVKTRAEVEADGFIIDSGASRHLVQCSDILTNVKSGPTHEIHTANGETLKGNMYGNLTLTLHLESNNGNFNTVELRDVLVVDGLSDNLLSVDALADKGVDCNFTKNKVVLIDRTDGNLVLGYGEARSDGLRYLACSHNLKSKAASFKSESIETWHDRLAHTAKSTIRNTVKNEIVTCVTIKPEDGSSSDNGFDCQCCTQQKLKRNPFNGTINSAEEIGDVIHSDVVGPLPATKGGKTCMVSFIDENSRTPSIRLMERKSDVTDSFKDFKVYFEKQNKCQIKAVKSDQGGEYLALNNKYLKKRGIKLEFSQSYCPEANGIAERLNRTVFDMVRSMLAHSSLGEDMCGEAATHAVFILNRLSTKTKDGNNNSPHERRTGNKPSWDKLHVFGCLAIVHNAKQQRKSKLESRGWNGIYLGTTENGLFRIMYLENGSVKLIRNVLFDERTFPAKAEVDSSDTDDKLSSESSEGSEGSTDFEPTSGDELEDDLSNDPDSSTDYSTPSGYKASSDSDGESNHESDNDSGSGSDSSEKSTSEEESIVPRTSGRIRQAPLRYRASVLRCLKFKKGNTRRTHFQASA